MISDWTLFTIRGYATISLTDCLRHGGRVLPAAGFGFVGASSAQMISNNVAMRASFAAAAAASITTGATTARGTFVGLESIFLVDCFVGASLAGLHEAAAATPASRRF